MNQDAHRVLRESLGAYALDQLTDVERTRIGAHLDQCADCRSELAEFEPVVGPLRAVDPDRLDRRPAPPTWLADEIVHRALDQVRQSRRSRRGRLAGIAAGVAAIALAGGIGYTLGAPDAPRQPVPVYSSNPEVHASATVIPHTWGVEITLDADGFRTGAVYRVLVLDDAGRTVSAGEFIGTGAVRMVCNLNSSVLRAQAAGFDVLDPAGGVVLHGDL